MDIKESVYDFYGVEECFKIAKIPWLKVKGGQRLLGLLSSLKAKLFSADLVYGRSLPGCYYSTFFGVPVFFESHHPVDEDTSGVFFNKLLKHDKFFGLVVISTALKQYYLANYNIDNDKINVVPDAADPIHCSDNNYTSSSERLRVGYVGQLYPGKGMEIIAELAKKCSWADFHIVGGVEEDIVKWEK